MNWVLDVLGWFDLIDRLEGLWSRLAIADWHGAYRSGGLAGLAAEFADSVLGHNSWRIRVPYNQQWTGGKVERLFGRYGIRVFDRGYNGSGIFFSVKREQAEWAEYILRRAGVPLQGPQFNPMNVEYARRHPPGLLPVSRRQRRRSVAGHSLEQWIERLSSLLD